VARSSRFATTVVVPRSKRSRGVGGGVARLDVDQEVVADDRGDLVVGRPQRAAEHAHRTRVDAQLVVVHGGQHPLEVGGLVFERRLGQLEVALLHGRAQDDMPADPDQRRLRPRLQRRHVDLEVLGHERTAGQAPATPELVDRERARVDGVHRHRPGDHPHLALLARAVAATGGVDGDAVPGGRVEHGRPHRHAHIAAVGAKLQAHPAGAGWTAASVTPLRLRAWPGRPRSNWRPTHRGRAGSRLRAPPRRRPERGRP